MLDNNLTLSHSYHLRDRQILTSLCISCFVLGREVIRNFSVNNLKEVMLISLLFDFVLCVLPVT